MVDIRESAIALAEEILENIELSNISLDSVMLKCARLARLTGDNTHLELFRYESGGYPITPDGIPPAAFEIGRIAGRVTIEKDKNGELAERMVGLSVAAMEAQIDASKIALASSADPDISLSSSNPNQHVFAPLGNQIKRDKYRDNISNMGRLLSLSRTKAYDYALSVLYELKFSKAVGGIFEKISSEFDRRLVNVSPSASHKVSSISENLLSENPEDWANAVHSCRRLMQQTADSLFPSRGDEMRNGRCIKLGNDNYVNRLICYIEDKSKSTRYADVIGTSLEHIGNRLDSVFKAAQKGSHSEISDVREAERYVIYTYMILSDILSL